MSAQIIYNDGEPCKHIGCLNHITHPCEYCGRIAGKGIVYQNIDKSNGKDMTCKATITKLPDGIFKVLNFEYE